MSKGTIKADVKLEFEHWVDQEILPDLKLVGDENDLSICTVMNGSVDTSAGRLYELLKAQKTEGKVPLFRLLIVDPEAEAVEKRLEEARIAKKNQEEFDLAKKTGQPVGQAVGTKEFLDKVPKVC